MKSEGKSQNVVQLPSESQEMSAVRMSFPRATSCKLSCVCLGLVCCCFVFRDTFIEVTHRATGHWGSQTTNHHVWAWNHAAWWHRAPQESRAKSLRKKEKSSSPRSISHRPSYLTPSPSRTPGRTNFGTKCFLQLISEARPHVGSKCFSKPVLSREAREAIQKTNQQ